MPMLRHIPTGDLYHMTPELNRRSDMEVVEDDAPPVTATEAAVKQPVKRKAPAKTPTE